MKRPRYIVGIEDEVWKLFAGHAKLLGLTQAEFLKVLIKAWIEHSKKNRKLGK